MDAQTDRITAVLLHPLHNVLLGFCSLVLDFARVSRVKMLNIKNLAVSLGNNDSLFDKITIYKMCIL